MLTWPCPFEGRNQGYRNLREGNIGGVLVMELLFVGGAG